MDKIQVIFHYNKAISYNLPIGHPTNGIEDPFANS